MKKGNFFKQSKEFNITRFYGVYKHKLASIDYAIKIVEMPADGTQYYMFFDLEGKLSDDSVVSTTTTPGVTTFGDIKGTSDWDITSFFCQITGHEVLRQTIGSARIVTGGVFKTSNGHNMFEFFRTPNASFLGTPLPEMDYGNNWTMYAGVSAEFSSDQQCYLATSDTNGSRISFNCDRSSSGLYVIRAGNFNTPIRRDNTDTMRRMGHVISENGVDLYLNDIYQGNQVDGAYVNEDFKIGCDRNNTSELDGYISYIMICDEAHNQIQRNRIDVEMGKQFGFVNFGQGVPRVFSTSDIIVEMGQSNMEGKDGDTANPSYPFITPNAWWFDGIYEYPLRTDRGDVFLTSGSHANYFAKKYNELTGRVPIMLELSLGGSGLTTISSADPDNWSATGDLRGNVETLVASALTYYGKTEPKAALWCQGERDAQEIDDNGAYTKALAKTGMQDVIDWWQTQYPGVPFLISELGDENSVNSQGWQDVRAMQQEIVDENSDVYMAFTGAKGFNALGWHSDSLHYTFEGYKQMGEQFAVQLSQI